MLEKLKQKYEESKIEVPWFVVTGLGAMLVAQSSYMLVKEIQFTKVAGDILKAVNENGFFEAAGEDLIMRITRIEK